MTRFAVIGAGAWGTALALVARRAGGDVAIWARSAAIAAAISEYHENPLYLPGVALDPSISATTDLAAVVASADAALIAVPAQFLRGTLAGFAAALPANLPLLLCAKGIETGSLKTMAEVVGELRPAARLAVLSGPSFAGEVAGDLPTAVVIASRDPSLVRFFATALANPRFRPYLSEDVTGVELGGAVKNVLAVACGIVDGLRLGGNARAALITRGLAEMTRLGFAKGARAETFAGLSGLGDLVLTCCGGLSRNHALGVALGHGRSRDEALTGARFVVEGVASAASIAALAVSLQVEMPIVAAVDAVLHRGMAIAPMIEGLLARPRRSE